MVASAATNDRGARPFLQSIERRATGALALPLPNRFPSAFSGKRYIEEVLVFIGRSAEICVYVREPLVLLANIASHIEGVYAPCVRQTTASGNASYRRLTTTASCRTGRSVVSSPTLQSGRGGADDQQDIGGLFGCVGVGQLHNCSGTTSRSGP